MKKLKVVTIAPQLSGDIFSEELGICSITAVLRECGHEVLLKPIIKDNEQYDDIIQFKPDMIGITAYNQTIELIYKICRDLKAMLPNTYIFVGGYAPTYHAVEMLTDCPEIDGAIIGEGEKAVVELVESIQKGEIDAGIKGLAMRNQQGQVVINERQEFIENLDELPFVSRDLLGTEGLTLVNSSRGCMRNCFFCCGNDFWKKDKKYSWRAKTIKSFVDEIEYLVKEHNRTQFWIVDASFEDPGFNEERMKGFAQEILNRKLEISYFVFFRATFYRKANDELMKLLVKSGLCEVFIGSEAANAHDLKILGKGITVEDNIRSIEFFKKYDIYPEIGFINFNPYSNFQGLRENADFLEEQGYACFFKHTSTVRIYKGSILYSMLEKDNLLKNTTFYDDDGYYYVNPQIATLVDYLQRHQRSLENEVNLSRELFLFERYYGDKLSHIKMHFKIKQHDNAVELVRVHVKNLDEILAVLNMKVSKWYKKILALAEDDWDESRADKITQSDLPVSELKDIFEQIRLEKIKFGRSLARADRAFMSLLRT